MIFTLHLKALPAKLRGFNLDVLLLWKSWLAVLSRVWRSVRGAVSGRDLGGHEAITWPSHNAEVRAVRVTG